MELNVGDYCRTSNGNIFKIIGGNVDNYEIDIDYSKLEQTEENWLELYRYNDNSSFFNDKNIIKSRPKIIDLIEENDLLKIEYFSLRYNKRVTRLFEVTFKDNKYINLNNAKCEFMLINGEFNEGDKELKPIIKSVLTHEQFEAMQYVVGDN